MLAIIAKCQHYCVCVCVWCDGDIICAIKVSFLGANNRFEHLDKCIPPLHFRIYDVRTRVFQRTTKKKTEDHQTSTPDDTRHTKDHRKEVVLNSYRFHYYKVGVLNSQMAHHTCRIVAARRIVAFCALHFVCQPYIHDEVVSSSNECTRWARARAFW